MVGADAAWVTPSVDAEGAWIHGGGDVHGAAVHADAGLCVTHEPDELAEVCLIGEVGDVFSP